MTQELRNKLWLYVNGRHTGGTLPTCFGSSIHYARLASILLHSAHAIGDSQRLNLIAAFFLAQRCHLINISIVQTNMIWCEMQGERQIRCIRDDCTYENSALSI